MADDKTTSRRSALRGVGLAAIAAGLAARRALASNQPDADADAELIRLCGEAICCDERIIQIDTHGTTDEDCATACEHWDRIFEEIAAEPATTASGLRAKAKALYAAVFREAVWGHGFEDYLENPGAIGNYLSVDGMIARSLCEDILAMGGTP